MVAEPKISNDYHVSQSRKECVLIPFQIAWQKIQESAKQQRKAGGAQGVAAC